MDDLLWKLDGYSLKPLAPPPHHTVEEDALDHLDYSLVVSGDIFRWMINHAPLETLQSVCAHPIALGGSNLLNFCHSDARAHPDLRQNVTRREERGRREIAVSWVYRLDVRRWCERLRGAQGRRRGHFAFGGRGVRSGAFHKQHARYQLCPRGDQGGPRCLGDQFQLFQVHVS
jgi:hypothetical protein